MVLFSHKFDMRLGDEIGAARTWLAKEARIVRLAVHVAVALEKDVLANGDLAGGAAKVRHVPCFAEGAHENVDLFVAVRAAGAKQVHVIIFAVRYVK